MPGGRPTTYTKAIGDEILSLMASGLSVMAAASDLGIGRRTIYGWEESIPEFKRTIELARAKRLAFLERRLLSATEGPVVTSSVYALKNADPYWRQADRVEITGADGGAIKSEVTIDTTKLSTVALRELIAARNEDV
jgi:hypothetical protein